MTVPVDRNAALLEAGLALSSELSLPAVLQRIVDLAAGITRARYCALGVIGPDGLIQEFVAHGVTSEQRHAIGPPPVGKGLLGLLISDARPYRIPDISKDPRSVGFPPNHPPMRSFLGAPVKAYGRVFGNIYLTEKRGAEEFGQEDEDALVILATQAGVAVENARLYAESQRRELRLEAVREVSTAILSGADAERVLQLVVDRARELVEGDFAALATVSEEDPGTFVQRVAVGAHARALSAVPFPAEGSISGAVVESGQPVTLIDASADDRTAQPLVAAGLFGPAMLVPLRAGVDGTLMVARELRGRTFAEDDLALLETFAAQAAVALEHERVQRDLHRLAIVADRERIAKDLHDGAIQALFAVGMGLQATATVSGDPQVERRVAQSVEEIDRVIRDLRNYIFGLRPGVLADRQLDQALRRIAEDAEESTGLVVATDIDPQVASLLSAHAADVVQLVREALSNVGRHANASTCRVSLRRGDGMAVLEIDDDGGGFDPDEAAGRGSGLVNMRARAESLGGRMAIASSPEDGTRITFDLPL